MNAWQSLKQYYFSLANQYHVDPVVFISIHIIATPLLLLIVAWIIRNKKQQKPILLPVLLAVILYNVANVYLVIAGRNIPFYIYLLLFGSTIYGGYITYTKIKRSIKMQ